MPLNFSRWGKNNPRYIICQSATLQQHTRLLRAGLILKGTPTLEQCLDRFPFFLCRFVTLQANQSDDCLLLLFSDTPPPPSFSSAPAGWCARRFVMRDTRPTKCCTSKYRGVCVQTDVEDVYSVEFLHIYAKLKRQRVCVCVGGRGGANVN